MLMNENYKFLHNIFGGHHNDSPRILYDEYSQL